MTAFLLGALARQAVTNFWLHWGINKGRYFSGMQHESGGVKSLIGENDAFVYGCMIWYLEHQLLLQLHPIYKPKNPLQWVSGIVSSLPTKIPFIHN